MGTSAENRRYRQRRKELIDGIKSVPCADCGQKFPPECMDFDHIRGEKEFSIGMSYGAYTIEALLKEIAKCEIVCSNCHRIRTRKRREDG